MKHVLTVKCVFPAFLDGLRPKEELLAAVYEDVCQEIDRLQGVTTT